MKSQEQVRNKKRYLGNTRNSGPMFLTAGNKSGTDLGTIRKRPWYKGFQLLCSCVPKKSHDSKTIRKSCYTHIKTHICAHTRVRRNTGTNIMERIKE